MSRNKYPEKTIEQILLISYKLFLEKGYEKTTIQDIINELGMTKGAIYHHFKSKEDILNAITDRTFNERQSFIKVKNDKNLSGLEKLRKAFCEELNNKEKQQLDKTCLSLVNNPKFISIILDNTLKKAAPIIEEFIEEGKKDGSISTQDSKSASEVMLILTNLWISPIISELNADDLNRKILFFKFLTDSIGIPLINDELLKSLNTYIKEVLN